MASTLAFPNYQAAASQPGLLDPQQETPSPSVETRHLGIYKRMDLEDRATPYRRSYVNDAVDILKSAGRSLKLHDLQARISAKRGKHVSLGSLKVCLSRYVDAEDQSKLLTRLAPGLFGLAEWEREHASGMRTRAVAAGSNQVLDSLSKLQSVVTGEGLSGSPSMPSFVWTLPADAHLGRDEQKVVICARDADEAYLRLELAGVLDARSGLLQLKR